MIYFSDFFSKLFKKGKYRPKTEKEIKNEKELADLTEIVENLPKCLDQQFLLKWIDSKIKQISRRRKHFDKKYPSNKSYLSAFLGPNFNDCIRMRFNDEIQYLRKLQILICLNV